MLLIKNGRVMDPKTGFDQITDLLVEENCQSWSRFAGRRSKSD